MGEKQYDGFSIEILYYLYYHLMFCLIVDFV